MSQIPWREARRVTRYAFYLLCVLVVSYVVLTIGSVLLVPFTGFSTSTEVTDASGAAAKRRIADWPDEVKPADVQSVSFKSESSRDSYSSWYRIQLTPDAAASWATSIHAQQENRSRQAVNSLQEGLEGVHRKIMGPPPQHRQTGETPTWWTPPSIEFRATEVMLWYTNHDSGVGRATYSAFDVSTGILWVYEYAAQQDMLWSHGQVLPGDRFSTNASHEKQG